MEVQNLQALAFQFGHFCTKQRRESCQRLFDLLVACCRTETLTKKSTRNNFNGAIISVPLFKGEVRLYIIYNII